MPIEILMPALSPTMTEGNLAKWNKKEGDSISSGDVIAEIETDKATMEFEAVDEGKLAKIFVNEGTQDVKVNQVIGLLLEDGEDESVIADYKLPEAAAPAEAANDEAPAASESAPAPEAAPAPAAPALGSAPKFEIPPAPTNIKAAPMPQSGGKVKASPLAKRLAADKGIDIAQVPGTGPHGRVIKKDVENFVPSAAGGGMVRRNPNEITEIPNNNMRKVIAKRLLESKQYIPHFYLSVDLELDKLLDARAVINGKAQKDEDGKPQYKVSVNDMIIKAVALGLRDVPSANASWTDEAVMQYNNVDVSVAVAIDGGLITPIVRNADQKSLVQISMEMKELAKRAREGSLQPEEFQGGGFSISNLGMFGIKNFSAIVNPPQSCILAVGAGEERAVPKNGEIKVVNAVSVTLSCDHRVVDGAVGADFLAAFKKYIQEPILMFV